MKKYDNPYDKKDTSKNILKIIENMKLKKKLKKLFLI